MSLRLGRIRWFLIFGPLTFVAICYGCMFYFNMRAVTLAERMFTDEERRFDHGVGTIDALNAASYQIVQAREVMTWPFSSRESALWDHVDRLRRIESQLIVLEQGILRDRSQSETLSQAIKYREQAEEMLLQYQQRGN